MNTIEKETQTQAAEVSLKQVLLKAHSGLRYLRSRWIIIFGIGLMGGMLGLIYSLTVKPKYTASCTFVLDDGSRTNALGQYAGLASMAGIDIGGSGSDGLFQGDNILELYKSRVMIEKALLSEADFNGKKELLIDKFLEFNDLKNHWKAEGVINLTFRGDSEKFNRKQDSIVTSLVESINKAVLSVTKPDKKLSIIKVDVISSNELFSKIFNEKLVQTVNNFYIQTKTKKALETVKTLQKQVDSLRIVLNSSITSVASAMDASPNANPALISLRVPSQKRQIDVQSSSAIYSEIIKNLEVSKMSLRQATPLLQIIDKPVLPLKMEKLGKIKSILIGSILSMFITIMIITMKKVFNYLIK